MQLVAPFLMGLTLQQDLCEISSLRNTLSNNSIHKHSHSSSSKPLNQLLHPPLFRTPLTYFMVAVGEEMQRVPCPEIICALLALMLMLPTSCITHRTRPTPLLHLPLIVLVTTMHPTQATHSVLLDLKDCM